MKTSINKLIKKKMGLGIKVKRNNFEIIIENMA